MCVCVCSAQSRNRDNSRIVLDKVGILTLSDEVGFPTWHGSIPESSLCKVNGFVFLTSGIFPPPLLSHSFNNKCINEQIDKH